MNNEFHGHLTEERSTTSALQLHIKNTIRWTDREKNEVSHTVMEERNILKKKGNAAPLQAWSGPEGSKKLRFPDFMTTAQDSGKVVSLTHRPPLPQEIHLVLISVRG